MKLERLLETNPLDFGGVGVPTKLYNKALMYASMWAIKKNSPINFDNELSDLFPFNDTDEGWNYWNEVNNGNIIYADGEYKVYSILTKEEHHTLIGYSGSVEDCDGYFYYINESGEFVEDTKVEPEPQLSDSIVKSVVDKFQERSEAGIKKYNNTLDRNDLCLVEWLNHLQEELMDATLYIQKLKEEV